MVRRLLSCVLLILPSTVVAQGDCFPPEDSHEAKAFAILQVPLAFGPVAGPAAMRPWTARIALETSYMPNVDSETATPTVCRPGKGPENTDFAAVLPRPRANLGLPWGMVLEASWVPPIEVNGAKPNLFGFALGRPFNLGSRDMLVGVRLHGTVGTIKAPITCDEEALQDPLSECFNGTLSDDKYEPNTFGADLTVGWSLGGGRVQPYVGTGVNLLRPRFQVNFTNQFGQLDNRKVEVDLERVVLFAGATWFPIPHLGLSGQIYSAPSDAVTGRLTISYGQ
jgi:hypothetical protein